MRLRLPAVLARGGDPRQASRDTSANGLGGACDEAEVIDKEHAPVRNDPDTKPWPRVSGTRIAAGRLLAPYSRIARRGARSAARELADVRPWLPGWVFAAVTVGPALLAVAWLVPGIGMLLAGRLLAVPMVIMFAALAVALCYFAMRRLPARWPRFGPAEPDAVRRRRRPAGADVPAGAVLAMVAVAAGFGVWQALLRSGQVFVAGDPGVYLQYGSWIAGHGTARVPVPAGAFGGAGGLDFATTGFSVSGSFITPSFVPGLPLVLAGGAWLGGLGGALAMPAVLGGCAVLSFGGLAGRLVGAWQAVAGELVLAVCLPQVYASRTPFGRAAGAGAAVRRAVPVP